MKRKNLQKGETLLETLIGLVIIGLVMMCLPMAVTATANINSKVAEQDVFVTLNPTRPDPTNPSDVVTTKVTIEYVSDDTAAFSSGAVPTVTYQNQPNNEVSGYFENRFYYYEFKK